MVVAKTTLDAIVKSKREGIPVHQALQALYRKDLWTVRLSMQQFTDQINESYSVDPLDREIARWHSLVDLLRVYTRDITSAIADKYLSFLVDYLGERDISMDELMSQVEDEDDEDDEDDEEWEDHGQTYKAGVSSILMEYFTRPFAYAKSSYYTDTVRALADVKDKPCVAIVMMSFHQDIDYRNNSANLKDINCQEKYRPTFEVQGIVACPIYKLLRRISVGSTFLGFFEDLSKETGRYIAVYPIGNEGWKRKLENSDRVLLNGSERLDRCE
jgi:hypothetical protein